MDPYLEDNWWTSVHAFLAPQIAGQLNRKIRPKYIASPEREYEGGALEEVKISAGSMRPDVAVRRSKGRSVEGGAATAVAPSVKLRTHLATKFRIFELPSATWTRESW